MVPFCLPKTNTAASREDPNTSHDAAGRWLRAVGGAASAANSQDGSALPETVFATSLVPPDRTGILASSAPLARSVWTATTNLPTSENRPSRRHQPATTSSSAASCDSPRARPDARPLAMTFSAKPRFLQASNPSAIETPSLATCRSPSPIKPRPIACPPSIAPTARATARPALSARSSRAPARTARGSKPLSTDAIAASNSTATPGAHLSASVAKVVGMASCPLIDRKWTTSRWLLRHATPATFFARQGSVPSASYVRNISF